MASKASEFRARVQRAATDEAVEYILNARDVHETDELGQTKLHYACYRRDGHPLVELLLFLGVDREKKNVRNQTAIDWAHIFFRSTPNVIALLTNGFERFSAQGFGPYIKKHARALLSFLSEHHMARKAIHVLSAYRFKEDYSALIELQSQAPLTLRRFIREDDEILQACILHRCGEVVQQLHFVWLVPFSPPSHPNCAAHVDLLLYMETATDTNDSMGRSLHDIIATLNMTREQARERELHSLASYLEHGVGGLKMRSRATLLESSSIKIELECDHDHDYSSPHQSDPGMGSRFHRLSDAVSSRSSILLVPSVSQREEEYISPLVPTAMPGTPPTTAILRARPPSLCESINSSTGGSQLAAPIEPARFSFPPGISRDQLSMQKEPVALGVSSQFHHGTLFGAPVLVKVFSVEKWPQDQLYTQVTREAALLGMCIHPNLAYFYGLCTDLSDDEKPFIAIVTERYSEGTLLDLLKRSGPDFDGRLAARLLAGIAQGLECLHACGIVHNNLTSENVHLRRDGEGNLHATLANFGLLNGSKLLRGHPSRETPKDSVVSHDGAAPKDLDIAHESEQASSIGGDLLALGVIAWHMATRELPWEGKTWVEIAELARADEKRMTFPPPSDLTWAKIELLVLQCFGHAPEDRVQLDSLVRSLEKV